MIDPKELRLGNRVHYNSGFVDQDINFEYKHFQIFEAFPERFTEIPVN